MDRSLKADLVRLVRWHWQEQTLYAIRNDASGPGRPFVAAVLGFAYFFWFMVAAMLTALTLAAVSRGLAVAGVTWDPAGIRGAWFAIACAPLWLVQLFVLSVRGMTRQESPGDTPSRIAFAEWRSYVREWDTDRRNGL